jgi:hypothetical protein
MTNNELEEIIYEYGHVMYRLGRMETDGNTSTKEYNKFSVEKEKLAKEIDEHFKNFSSQNKLKKALHFEV